MLSAPLLHHVFGIVLNSPQPQMKWVDAWSVVARMEHPQAIRNLAVMKDPRSAMCRHALAPANVNVPIAGCAVDQPAPRPTLVRCTRLDSRLDVQRERDSRAPMLGPVSISSAAP